MGCSNGQSEANFAEHYAFVDGEWRIRWGDLAFEAPTEAILRQAIGESRIPDESRWGIIQDPTTRIWHADLIKEK